jgi:hypothetical protein
MMRCYSRRACMNTILPCAQSAWCSPGTIENPERTLIGGSHKIQPNPFVGSGERTEAPTCERNHRDRNRHMRSRKTLFRKHERLRDCREQALTARHRPTCHQSYCNRRLPSGQPLFHNFIVSPPCALLVGAARFGDFCSRRPRPGSPRNRSKPASAIAFGAAHTDRVT